MFNPSTLIIAAVLSCSALWSGFVTGSMSVTDALIRFLIAVPVAALMSFAFRVIVRNYGPGSKSEATAADGAPEPVAGLEPGQAVR